MRTSPSTLACPQEISETCMEENAHTQTKVTGGGDTNLHCVGRNGGARLLLLLLSSCNMLFIALWLDPSLPLPCWVIAVDLGCSSGTPECRDPPGRRSLGVEEGSILMFPYSSSSTATQPIQAAAATSGSWPKLRGLLTSKHTSNWLASSSFSFFCKSRGLSPISNWGSMHICLNKGICQTPPPGAPLKVDPQHV